MTDPNPQLTHQNPQSLIDELDEILDQERSALVRGELQQIEGLLARKEAIIANLNMVCPRQIMLFAIPGSQPRILDLEAGGQNIDDQSVFELLG